MDGEQGVGDYYNVADVEELATDGKEEMFENFSSEKLSGPSADDQPKDDKVWHMRELFTYFNSPC